MMVEYKDINIEEIQIIKDLWCSNLDYHFKTEMFFKEQYSKLSFEERMDTIFENANLTKITIAQEKTTPVGYCISKIENQIGEIMSLHVLKTKRKLGIGKQLTQTHIDWLTSNSCSKIGLYVASGNTKTIEFYKQFGLESNLTYMQIVNQNSRT